jgi:hypothetical protein
VWPVAARAQQLDRLRRIGLLMAWAQSDPEVQPRMAAFIATLRELGWIDGRNCRIELRWSAGDLRLMQRHAKELIDSAPDVIMAGRQSKAFRPAQRQSGAKPHCLKACHTGSGFSSAIFSTISTRSGRWKAPARANRLYRPGLRAIRESCDRRHIPPASHVRLSRQRGSVLLAPKGAQQCANRSSLPKLDTPQIFALLRTPNSIK